jgi:hypothetical protein
MNDLFVIEPKTWSLTFTAKPVNMSDFALTCNSATHAEMSSNV